MSISVALRDGRGALIRPVREDDAARIQDFVRGLRPQSRRARFFAAIAELTAQQLRQVLSSRGLSLAAVDDAGTIVALAQYALDGDGAELAVVVHDGWRENGLGEQLLELLRLHARRTGARILGGLMQADNQAMRGLARKLGFAVRRAADPALLHFETIFS